MSKEKRAPSTLDRRVVVPKLIGNPDDFLIVAGLAGASKDVGAMTKESANTFLFGGAMGAALMTGLGLALAQPKKRVLVVTGDGELLMSFGALSTIASLQPKNLAILCIDNELHGETGNQHTHTGGNLDLRAVAEGCGFDVAREVRSEAEIADESRALRQSNGPAFVVVKVSGGPPGSYKRNWDAAEKRVVFRNALLGSQGGG